MSKLVAAAVICGCLGYAAYWDRATSHDAPQAPRPAVAVSPKPTAAVSEAVRNVSVETMLFRLRGEAVAAVRCGLRSRWWGNSLDDGILGVLYAQANREGWNDDVRARKESTFHAVSEDVAKRYRDMNDCARLLSSGKLDEIDRLRSRLTGNYH